MRAGGGNLRKGGGVTGLEKIKGIRKLAEKEGKAG